MTPNPCRLFVYLARDAPVGIVLRRGPSAWARLSLWHSNRDIFEHGQWFRGRIYEHRSRISVDGSPFLHFALKDGARSSKMDQVDSWLTLSRPPWFTALALWPVGATYALDGYFITSTSMFMGVDAAPRVGQLPFRLASHADLPAEDEPVNSTVPAAYGRRLRRGGRTDLPGSAGDSARQKLDPVGTSTLIMDYISNTEYGAHGGPSVVEFSVTRENGTRTHLGRATWADWDQQGRLVVAQHGRLLQWQPSGELQKIESFNSHRPEPVASPEWARVWPRRPAHRR